MSRITTYEIVKVRNLRGQERWRVTEIIKPELAITSAAYAQLFRRRATAERHVRNRTRADQRATWVVTDER